MSARFGFALIAATAMGMLVCMFPLTRALSKVGSFDIYWFMLHEVAPRIVLALLIFGAALVLHLRGSRWGWIMLSISPLLVFVADLGLMALPG